METARCGIEFDESNEDSITMVNALMAVYNNEHFEGLGHLTKMTVFQSVMNIIDIEVKEEQLKKLTEEK